MSRSGAVTFEWADGEYPFRLAIGQIRELQEKCDAGPQHILRRIASGDWKVDDLRETIRLGLIGGGLDALQARRLIERYVDERPLAESVTPAMAILGAAIIGAPDEEVGKKKTRRTRTNSPTAKSASPDCTDSAPS